jgi:sensor domain CHASE-containing protein
MMSVETRLRLGLVGLVALAVVTVAGAGAFVLLDRFGAIEESEIGRDVDRARTAIADYLVVLKGKAGDWAQWDESYEFIANPSTDFVERNVPTNSLVQLDLNLVVFLDAGGKTVFAKGVDAATGNTMPVPPPFDRQVPRESPLLQDAAVGGVVGMLMVDGKCLLAAARPILTSEGHGPARGTLIFGRFVDDPFIERMRGLAHVDLSFRPYDSEPMPRDFREGRDALETFDDVYVQRIDSGRMAAYALIPGLDSRPALVLRVETPRLAHEAAVSALLSLVGIAAGAFVVFGVLAWLLARRWLALRPVPAAPPSASVP